MPRHNLINRYYSNTISSNYISSDEEDEIHPITNNNIYSDEETEISEKDEETEISEKDEETEISEGEKIKYHLLFKRSIINRLKRAYIYNMLTYLYQV